MAETALFVRLNPADNVVVARLDLLEHTMLGNEGVSVVEPIPAGHKVAVRPIAKGEPVRKFNQIIGFASDDILPGQHIHVHNCKMQDFARDYAVGQDVRATQYVPEDQRPSFGGYLRENGKVGTRNYIGILSTVNCSASVSKFIAEKFPAEELAKYDRAGVPLYLVFPASGEGPVVLPQILSAGLIAKAVKQAAGPSAS